MIGTLLVFSLHMDRNMATIVFNAFSFLQKKLRAKNQPYAEAAMDIADGSSITDLLRALDLEEQDVEAAFVNGTVVSFDTVLKDRDRVALVPPGTPGPYRVMLAMVQRRNDVE
jgi:sulfur carrier protein ThiS